MSDPKSVDSLNIEIICEWLDKPVDQPFPGMYAQNSDSAQHGNLFKLCFKRLISQKFVHT